MSKCTGPATSQSSFGLISVMVFPTPQFTRWTVQYGRINSQAMNPQHAIPMESAAATLNVNSLDAAGDSGLRYGFGSDTSTLFIAA
ncbi:MAG: hypothetical protein ABJZ55_07615 [Fuerstiella sp.]